MNYQFRQDIPTQLYLLLMIFLAMPIVCSGQDEDLDERIRIEVLEGQVKSMYGREKLMALIDISNFYTERSGRKATRYGRQAVILAEDMFVDDIGNATSDPLQLHPKSYVQLGRAYYHNNKYIDAKEAFEKAAELASSASYEEGVNVSGSYLSLIDSLANAGQDMKRGFISQSFKSLELKEKVSRTTLDWNINAKINAAEAHRNKYEYDEAISDYQDAINLLRNKGDEEQIDAINLEITEIRRLQNVSQEVIENYNEAIAEQERIVQELAQPEAPPDTLELTAEVIDEEEPKDDKQELAPFLVMDVDNLEEQSDSLAALANAYLAQKDYSKAEEYRLLSSQVEDEIRKREDAETQLTLLRQQKQLAEADLQRKNMELDAQAKAERSLFIGLALLVALALALLTLYITKQRAHRKLGSAYKSLEETQSKLATAEGNIRKLLHQQVSEDIAMELMNSGATLGTKKSFVCIMFLDIRGFTPWAEKHGPEEIIEYQNKVFGFMIDIVNAHNGNINQLLGDGFMATFGAPRSDGNDCQNAYEAASEIIARLENHQGDEDLENTRIGIGLHAGYVVTGNVGTELRKQYSITGNTVILASRIEQLNKDFGTQLIISKEVYDKLDRFEQTAEFRQVKVKGRKTPIDILTVA